MSSALDEFERSLVTASRALHALQQTAPTQISATPDTERPPVSGPRVRRPFRQRRLMFSFAALVVLASSVATAASLLWPSQRLADGRVNCFMATHGTGVMDGRTLAVGPARPNGQPPISLCRMWYRLNSYRLNGSPTGPKVANLPLIACQENATTVGVYVATGQPDQCRRLDEKPLPATYARAAARLRDLQDTLFRIQDEQDCISVTTLVRDTRTVLANQDFSGWRVITPPPDPGKHWLMGYALPAGTGGTCGTLRGNPTTSLDIDTQRQLLTVSIAPPRSISLELNHISAELYGTTYDRCFTARSARALVRQSFASTRLRPRFATANTSDGSTYEPRSQRLYDQGCVRFESAIPGNNNRFVDVLLNARNAVRLPAGQFYPPANSFHP
jgi:hypothetical protein